MVIIRINDIFININPNNNHYLNCIRLYILQFT